MTVYTAATTKDSGARIGAVPPVRHRYPNIAVYAANGANAPCGDGSVKADVDALKSPQKCADEVHPLDVSVQPLDLARLGWLGDYAHLATRLTASPQSFNVTSGLAILAVTLGRNACLPMAFGNVFPNLYAAIVATSTVYHKSTSINFARDVLLATGHVDLLASGQFTYEGLLKELEAQPVRLAVQNEVGLLFGSDRQKGPYRELKQRLTDIYDGGPASKSLSQSAVVVDAPCLSLLGATTPARFYSSMSPLDWADGFAARWLFAVPDAPPDFDAAPQLRTQNDIAAMKDLSHRLAALHDQPAIDFIIDRAAFDCWAAYQRDALRSAFDGAGNDDILLPIVGRYNTYTLKLALIVAAACDSWGRITLGTIETAILLVDHYKLAIHQLLTGQSKQTLTREKVQKVFHIIHRGTTDGAGPNKRELQQASHLRAGEIQQVLDVLLNLGAIVTTEDGKHFRAEVDDLPLRPLQALLGA